MKLFVLIFYILIALGVLGRLADMGSYSREQIVWDAAFWPVLVGPVIVDLNPYFKNQ